jgi:hypothetical protein
MPKKRLHFTNQHLVGSRKNDALQRPVKQGGRIEMPMADGLSVHIWNVCRQIWYSMDGEL